MPQVEALGGEESDDSEVAGPPTLEVLAHRKKQQLKVEGKM